MSFKEDLKKVMILYPDLEVQSSDDYRTLISIHNIVEAIFKGDSNLKIVKSAFDDRLSSNLETANDYYYLVFKTASKFKGLKKVAYPNLNDEMDIGNEFDISKWADLVHKTFQAVHNGDMTLNEALDYYADTLDTAKGEDESFKRWVRYYQTGEHLKYSDDKTAKVKKANFQFPLNSPGFYGPDNAIIPNKRLVPDSARMNSKVEKKEEYSDWKTKLYSAIRRIDKLLRQSDDLIDLDSQRELADLLHHFDQEVRALRHQTTASDLAFRYANQFKKLGFNSGYQEFLKYAQEVPQESLDEVGPPLVGTPPPPGSPQEPMSDLEIGNQGSASSPEDTIGRTLQHRSEKSSRDVIKDDSQVSLADAISKLEEVASRLSDRKTIRLLAEFDIILDRIGIAAMFPEIAEAQSKLIDGYSYALTRVTKMLGMLSSGKSLSDISEFKQHEISDKAMKEVNKTFEGKPEAAGGSPEASIDEGMKPSPALTAPESPAVAPEKPPTI